MVIVDLLALFSFMPVFSGVVMSILVTETEYVGY